MKITDITVYLAKEWRTFLFLVIDTDEGIYGVGESGVTAREHAVAGVIEHFKPMLIGEDPLRIEHIWQRLSRAGYPGHRLTAAAIAAVDIALWDIKGKAAGMPVYQLLGGRVRDKMPTYGHIHSRNTEQLVERVQEAIAEGWKCVRWDTYYNEETREFDPRKAAVKTLEEFRAIREAVGFDIDLIFDGHTRLAPSEAAWICREAEQYRPFFMEDMLRAEYIEGYRQLRQQTGVPLAAGEKFSSKWDYRPLVEEDLINYARLDLCISGGITESKKIAGWCETHYIDIAVHNPIGPVSTAACLHFNLSCSNAVIHELPRRPGETMADVVTGLPEWKDGYLMLPEKPGLGIEFEREAVKNYPYVQTPRIELQRPDGTFTNW